LLSSQRGRLLAEGFKGMKVDSVNRNQLYEFYLLDNFSEIGFKSLKTPLSLACRRLFGADKDGSLDLS
jgi:hypothetical protein